MSFDFQQDFTNTRTVTRSTSTRPVMRLLLAEGNFQWVEENGEVKFGSPFEDPTQQKEFSNFWVVEALDWKGKEFALSAEEFREILKTL